METLIQKGWPSGLRERPDGLREFDFKNKDLQSYLPVRGIYFLFRKDDLIYIGKSNNLYRRMVSHRRQKTFDKVLYLPIEDRMSFVEIQLIRHFQPGLNSAPKDLGMLQDVFAKADKSTLKQVLSTISDIQRGVIVNRYGLFGTLKYTLQEIGDSYGLTRERIRQIQRKAERRIIHPSRMIALKKK